MTEPEAKELRKKHHDLLKERDDWKEAYQMTEAVLTGNNALWQGRNERWKNGKPILALKLAKELMGKGRYTPSTTKSAVPLPPVRDYYLELVEWMGAGHCRTVRKGPDHLWHIRDEARSAEMTGENLNLMLRSKEWDAFRSRP